MNGKCEWKEEQLFDFVYKKLPEQKAKELLIHLESCEKCQKKVGQWQEIVQDMDETIEPSPLLKEQINDQIKRTIKPKRKKWVTIRTVALVGSLIVFLSVLRIFPFQNTPDHDDYLVKQNEEISENTIVNDPQTNQFNVIPLANFHQVEGKVWINDITNEMLMKVDGLIPVVEKDYQLWLIKENDELDGELLQTEDGRILLYYRGSGLNEVRFLQVSLERKGGSQKPSGPDTFYVDLKR